MIESKRDLREILEKWLKNLQNGEFRDFLLFLTRKIYSLFPSQGVRVMEEEWDYLIVLDACRYDAFKRLNDLPGKLEKRISRGSSTEEWLRKNFTGYYEDTVYISGNPFVSEIEIRDFNAGDHFFKIEEVWKYGWDEHLGTTPPGEVTKAALRLDKEFPKKRKIIHYLQPHDPFIGKTKLISKGDKVPLWKDPKVKQAWLDNLKLVLREVRGLVKKLEGKITITADHGDSFRKNFLLRHPQGIHVKELIEVPWLVVKNT